MDNIEALLREVGVVFNVILLSTATKPETRMKPLAA